MILELDEAIILMGNSELKRVRFLNIMNLTSINDFTTQDVSSLTGETLFWE